MGDTFDYYDDVYDSTDAKTESLMLSFTVQNLKRHGKSYSFFWKDKEHFVPQSYCRVRMKKSIIQMPDWLADKKGLQ